MFRKSRASPAVGKRPRQGRDVRSDVHSTAYCLRARQVSREELHEAMLALGLDAPKKDINALFSSWDPDGSGTPSL